MGQNTIRRKITAWLILLVCICMTMGMTAYAAEPGKTEDIVVERTQHNDKEFRRVRFSTDGHVSSIDIYLTEQEAAAAQSNGQLVDEFVTTNQEMTFGVSMAPGYNAAGIQVSGSHGGVQEIKASERKAVYKISSITGDLAVTVISEEHEHTPSVAAEESVMEPGCETEGSYDAVVYCESCGKELERTTHTTPPIGHDWDEGTVEQEATCSQEGVTVYTCRHDNSHTKTEPLGKKEHIAGEPEIQNRQEATCTQDGSYEEVIYCVECGEELSRESVMLPKTGHKPGDAVIENEVQPTCTEDGSYEEVIRCSICGEELERKPHSEPVVGHDWDDGVVNKEATCEQEGEMLYTCRRDESHTKTDVIKATGHRKAKAVKENVVKPGCKTKGSYDKVIYCKNCGKELSRKTKTTKATGHSWGSWKVTEKDGTVYKERVCRNDKSHKQRRVIKETGETPAQPQETPARERQDLSEDEDADRDVEITCSGTGASASATLPGYNPDDDEDNDDEPVERPARQKADEGRISTGETKPGFTIKWSGTCSKETGYQVKYSLRPCFGSAVIVTLQGDASMLRITGLPEGQECYIKARTFRTIGGRTYYSGWSKVQGITIK